MASSISLQASTETYDPITLPATWGYLLTPANAGMLSQSGGPTITYAAVGAAPEDDTSNVATINYPGGTVTTGLSCAWGSTNSGGDFTVPVGPGYSYRCFVYGTAYEVRETITCSLADASAAAVSSTIDAGAASGYMARLISFDVVAAAATTLKIRCLQDLVYVAGEGNAHFCGVWIVRTATGGTTYPATAADAAVASHAQAAKLTFKGTATQAAASSDLAHGYRTAGVTGADVAGSSDSAASGAAWSVSSNDAAAASDGVAAGAAWPVSSADAAAATDGVIALATWPASSVDAAAADDLGASLTTFLATCAVTVSAADVSSQSGQAHTYMATGFDGLSLLDLAGSAAAWQVRADESVALLEVAGAASIWSASASDQVVLAEKARVFMQNNTVSAEWHYVVPRSSLRFAVPVQSLRMAVEPASLPFTVESKALAFRIEPDNL